MKSRIVINCLRGVIIDGISFKEIWFIQPYKRKKFTFWDKILWIPLEKIKCKAPWFGYKFEPGNENSFVYPSEDQYIKNIYKK